MYGLLRWFGRRNPTEQVAETKATDALLQTPSTFKKAAETASVADTFFKLFPRQHSDQLDTQVLEGHYVFAGLAVLVLLAAGVYVWRWKNLTDDHTGILVEALTENVQGHNLPGERLGTDAALLRKVPPTEAESGVYMTPRNLGDYMLMDPTLKTWSMSLKTPVENIRLKAELKNYPTSKHLGIPQKHFPADAQYLDTQDDLWSTSSMSFLTEDHIMYPTKHAYDIKAIDFPALTVKEVRTFPMPQVGESLYYALAHQLMGARVASVNHKADALILRSQLLQHIFLEQESYRHLILRSVAFHRPRYSRLVSEEAKVEQYLRDLKRPVFPPGDEVLQAAADLKKVDVLVFSDDGPSLEFKSASAAVIGLIAVKRKLIENDEFRLRRYHYDSIVNESPD